MTDTRTKAQRQPDGYAYRYPSMFSRGGTIIEFTHGEERNGSKPIEAVPYFFGSPPDAPAPTATERDAALRGGDAGLRELRKIVAAARERNHRRIKDGDDVLHDHVFATRVALCDWVDDEIDTLLAAAPDQAAAGKVEPDGPSAGACVDCGRRYGDRYGFPDLVVPHDVWNNHLSPNKDSSGLLCPSCMCRRAHAAGLEGVPATFQSGPFCVADAGKVEPAPFVEDGRRDYTFRLAPSLTDRCHDCEYSLHHDAPSQGASCRRLQIEIADTRKSRCPLWRSDGFKKVEPAAPPPADAVCDLCGKTFVNGETDGHGLGECAPVCETCGGSGSAQPPPADADLKELLSAIAGVESDLLAEVSRLTTERNEARAAGAEHMENSLDWRFQRDEARAELDRERGGWDALEKLRDTARSNIRGGGSSESETRVAQWFVREIDTLLAARPAKGEETA